MSTLEVRDLEVEAGGRTVVEGPQLHAARGRQDGRGRAATVPARPARSRCSPGRLRRRRALPIRRGALGYLRQDPRQHREDDGISGLEYILAARDLVDMARRLEKVRIQLEEDHAETQRGAVRTGWRRSTATPAATRPNPRRERSPRGSGLAQDRLSLPVGALSGGERRRLELARILFGGSDLLLLDEPTNHLDADAKTWLMKFLATYKGALMVVSHDLGLLDASITRILHLDRDGVVEYRGTYSQYRTARQA